MYTEYTTEKPKQPTHTMRNRFNDKDPRPTEGAGLPVGVGWIGRLGGVFRINYVAYKRCVY